MGAGEAHRRVKGVLVAFEGIDGAGKTTQAQRLLQSLQEMGCVASLLKEPTDSPWGIEIRKLALNGRQGIPKEKELELFEEDRKLNISKNIAPRLAKNEIVIMDRYYFSTIAYQGARGLDPAKIKEKQEVFSPKPDLVIILDVAPRVGTSRIRNGRGEDTNHFEEEEYLREVRRIFRTLDDSYIQEIDGSSDTETVARHISNIVQPILQTRPSSK